MPLIAACFLSGCEKRPQGVLSDKEMAELMADIHLSESYISSSGSAYLTDSACKALRQAILRDHGVTEAQLDSTLAWYGRNIDKYPKLYDRVAKILEKRSNTSADEELTPVVAGDFSFPLMVQLSSRGSANYFFDFPTEDLKKGSLLEFKARVTPFSSRGDMAIFLAVDYSDKSSDYSFSSSSSGSAGRLSITLQTDSSLDVTRVYGYLRPESGLRSLVWLDSLSISTSPVNPVSYTTERTRVRSYGGKSSKPKNQAGKDSLRKAEQTSNVVTVEEVSAERSGMQQLYNRRPDNLTR